MHADTTAMADELTKIALSDETKLRLQGLAEGAALMGLGYAVGGGMGSLANRFVVQGAKGTVRKALIHGAGALGGASGLALMIGLHRARELQDAKAKQDR